VVSEHDSEDQERPWVFCRSRELEEGLRVLGTVMGEFEVG
jgi:hypothetical protein